MKAVSLSSLKWMVSALIVLTVVLPSGSLFGFNFKMAITALCFIALLFSFMGGRLPVVVFVSPVLFLVFLVFYFLVSNFNDVPVRDAVSHAVAFTSVFVLIYIPLYVVLLDNSSVQHFKDVIFYSGILYCLIKFVLGGGISSGGITPEMVQLFLHSTFGFEFIGLDAGYFYRIHVPMDFLLPLLMLYMLCYCDGKYSAFQSLSLLALILVAVVLSYSRLIYFMTGVAFFLVYIRYLLARLSAVRKLSLLAGGVMLSIIFFYFFFDFIKERFTGEMAGASDGPRVEMYEALIHVIREYPILGKGLGSAGYELIRFEDMPWYYELQWMSFFAQFGVIGFVFLLSLSLVPVLKFMSGRFDWCRFSVVVLYLLWLGVGIFNGFMLTSSAGVIFLFFVILIFRFEKKAVRQSV